MDGSLGKNFLKNYILKLKPVLGDYLDYEMTKVVELGYIPVELLKSYSEMVSAGKGIRGALVMLAYQACGGKNDDEILKVSAFIELFHSAILVHDDFMDRDNTRRGLATVHTKFKEVGDNIGVNIPSDHYGNSLAVCLGNAGFYMSWNVLLRSKFSPENVLAAGKVYADYITRLGFGQALDMTMGGIKNAEEKDILNVLWIKSGEYTSLLPMLVGAALAGATDPSKLNDISKYAECLGWAFQIQDDLLSTFGNSAETGKPTGNDIREGKNTLLTLHLRNNGTEEQKKFLEYCLGNANLTDSEAAELRNVFKVAGSYDYVVNKGNEYVADGIEFAKKITEKKELQEILESLIVYMMERSR